MSLDHLALLAADIDACAAALAAGPADAPVAGCPGWSLHALGAHLGGVQRWARAAILTGQMPKLDPADDPVPPAMADLAAWLRAGGERLLATLTATDPQQPTWHPFPVEPKLAGLWRRRQAQEASVHRWDAELAAGLEPTIDSGFAADGVDEYWHVMLPRMLSREQRPVPASVFGVQLTDTGQRWVIDGRSGRVEVVAPDTTPDTTPDAEITGGAVDVLLRLWGRPVAEATVLASGAAVVSSAWLALGGA
ncbi:MAG: maleylpyruvate isomerase family mycothiol-dependent enzyme [Actinomycetota bacterium]|nr:maleylpyruvate isomerase family mycothiol-dependent enzyme [Actinomycetota bacterium]